MRTPVLMLLLFVLTACAAPSQTPPPQKIRDTATPEMAPTPTNIPPTATATMVIYDFSASDPTDISTWPEEKRAYYENLSKRAEAKDQDEKLEFIRQDRVFHEFLMAITINFLDQQGIDMSEFQGEDVDLLSVANSNKIAEAFGIWQKATFDETGEAPLMPADPWLIREGVKTKLKGDGESTDKVSVFGVKTKIEGLKTQGQIFKITGLMENPFNENSAIILAQSPEGMRPFLVIFEDTIIDRNQFVFSPATKRESILPVEYFNNLRKEPFDLLTARQLDGSAPIIDTKPLTLSDIFIRLGTEVTGYQTDRITGKEGLNGDVVFNALFDSKTGLEILGGISETDGTRILPITEQ